MHTPIAVLRSDIEFRMLAVPGPDESRVLAGKLATVVRMQDLVRDLLLLARIEGRSEVLATAATDVVAMI